jgi:hypothetical protein
MSCSYANRTNNITLEQISRAQNFVLKLLENVYDDIGRIRTTTVNSNEEALLTISLTKRSDPPDIH